MFDGNRIPGLSRQVIDAVVRVGGERGFGELRGQHRSAVPVDDANTAEAPGHFLLDVRAGAGRLRLGSVEVAPIAGVNNVFDRRYVAAVTVNAFGGRFFEPGPPRTFHLGVRAALGAR